MEIFIVLTDTCGSFNIFMNSRKEEDEQKCKFDFFQQLCLAQFELIFANKTKPLLLTMQMAKGEP